MAKRKKPSAKSSSLEESARKRSVKNIKSAGTKAKGRFPGDRAAQVKSVRGAVQREKDRQSGKTKSKKKG